MLLSLRRSITSFNSSSAIGAFLSKIALKELTISCNSFVPSYSVPVVVVVVTCGDDCNDDVIVVVILIDFDSSKLLFSCFLLSIESRISLTLPSFIGTFSP